MTELKWLGEKPDIVPVERDGTWFWEARTPAGRECLALMARRRLPVHSMIHNLEDPDAETDPVRP